MKKSIRFANFLHPMNFGKINTKRCSPINVHWKRIVFGVLSSVTNQLVHLHSKGLSVINDNYRYLISFLK